MKKTKMESYTSEYCMSAGDNAVSRDEINASITSRATANEHSFRAANMDGLNEIADPATKAEVHAASSGNNMKKA